MAATVAKDEGTYEELKKLQEQDSEPAYDVLPVVQKESVGDTELDKAADKSLASQRQLVKFQIFRVTWTTFALAMSCISSILFLVVLFELRLYITTIQTSIEDGACLTGISNGESKGSKFNLCSAVRLIRIENENTSHIVIQQLKNNSQMLETLRSQVDSLDRIVRLTSASCNATKKSFEELPTLKSGYFSALNVSMIAVRTDLTQLSQDVKQTPALVLSLVRNQNASLYVSTQNVKKNWTAAEEHCTKLGGGGHLVTIDSLYKANFVSNLAVTYNVTTYWIGLHKPVLTQNCNGSHYWVATNKTPQYCEWLEKEPNCKHESNKKEACVEVSVRGDNGRGWNDNMCDEKNNFICEF